MMLRGILQRKVGCRLSVASRSSDALYDPRCTRPELRLIRCDLTFLHCGPVDTIMTSGALRES